MRSNIGYTTKLTEYVINESKSSTAIQAQLESPHKDIFTGLPFLENTGNLDEAQKAEAFRSHISNLSDEDKAAAYVQIMSIPSQQELEAMVEQGMAGQTRETMQTTMVQVLVMQTGMSEAEMEGYISSMTDAEVEEFFRQLVAEQAKMQYAAAVQGQMTQVPAQQLVMALEMAMEGYTDAECAMFYDEILEFAPTSYDENLISLGYLDLASPSKINLYAVTFESKDTIEAAISAYNEGVDELHQINYTDYVGLIMSSVTTIINAITYVLIAFVAVSLIVSSIMIGVITLISVQERTKEIGVLRAIGASKRNVSNMFNAETIMIGFGAGALGVLVTVLICIPINAILYNLTGIANLRAFLPWDVGALLIGISVVLTTIAGLIPARSAAKKDPVVALRTE